MNADLTVERSDVSNKYYLVATGGKVGAMEIAAWLNDDINHISEIDFWREKMKNLSSENVVYLGTGNAHEAYVVGAYVYLSCEFVAELKVMLHSYDFCKLLDDYEDFLKLTKSRKPDGFSVNYYCEGVAAEEMIICEKAATNI